MNELNYNFKNHTLTIEGRKILFDYKIQDALVVPSGCIVVMLDRESNKQKWGEFKNLFGVTSEGKIIWNIGAPNKSNTDCFWKITLEEDNLHAYSLSSYDCTIDPLTGKIIVAEFYK